MASGTSFFPVAATVAGSDSGGGAGIQADLRTFAAMNVFGVSALTALTAQNPGGVRAVHPVPPEFLEAQLDAISEAFNIGAAKTGMLFSVPLIRVVVSWARRSKVRLVVDPVAVATSGARLLEPDAAGVIAEELLPLAEWATPNRMEAEAILKREIRNLDEAAAAAVEFRRRWGCACVVKGGHLDESDGMSTDAAATAEGVFILRTPRVQLPCPVSAHGTGCTFSAALAAGLASELAAPQNLLAAKDFVFGSLSNLVNVGHGLDLMFPPRRGQNAVPATLEPWRKGHV